MKQKLLLTSLGLLAVLAVNAQIYDNDALDAEDNFVVGGTSWASSTITYYFLNGTPDISGTTAERNAIRDAFEIWEDFTNLNFVEGTSASNSDIVISWGAGDHGDDFPFDGVGTVLAHAFQPPANGTTHDLTGDIHFDEDETWTTATRTAGGNPRDLVTVAAHEIGHALGLRHTTVAGSLMVGGYTGSHRFLCLDDIQGIQDIYGGVTNYTAIQGDDTICGTGNVTYTIDGVCDFTGISWTSSSNIQIVSHTGGSVTVKKIGGGSTGWFQANIQGVLLRKNVTLTTTVDIILDTAEFEGSAFYVAAHATGGSAPYNWYINGQLISTTSSSSFSYRYPCSTGSSYVGVVANTACGSRSDQAYYYEDCGSGHRMVVYPNPASSEITISQMQEKKEVYYTSLSSESISQARDIVLTLLDFTGKPVKEMAFNEPTQDVKMDISTLTKGIYFLRIVGNNVDETHTVVIE
jgi:predicted Zn-dependent protease